jgi:hypothetical protein
MKKTILLISLTFLALNILKAQNNIGIFIGGGFTDLRFITDSAKLNKDINKTEFKITKAYHAGFNFENILIERKLYLMLGIHAESSGYSSHNDSILFFIHNIHLPLEVKYKYFFSKRGESYVYVSGGPYVATAYKGIKYNQFEIDDFLNDAFGNTAMTSPKIKFGKMIEDDIETMISGLILEPVSDTAICKSDIISVSEFEIWYPHNI